MLCGSMAPVPHSTLSAQLLEVVVCPALTLKAALSDTLSITSGTMRSLARMTVVSLIRSAAGAQGQDVNKS